MSIAAVTPTSRTRADRAAETGMDAEHDLGQAEHRLGVVHADAIAAGQREFESAAEAVAIDRGDGRERQRLEPIQDGVRRADERHGFLGRRDLAELADVGAGDETRLAGGDHQAARGGGCNFIEPRGELLHCGPGQRVGARAGLVEAQPCDALRIDLERPLRAARCAGLAHRNSSERPLRRRRAARRSSGSRRSAGGDRKT